jgi:hypothetical protein
LETEDFLETTVLFLRVEEEEEEEEDEVEERGLVVVFLGAEAIEEVEVEEEVEERGLGVTRRSLTRAAMELGST